MKLVLNAASFWKTDSSLLKQHTMWSNTHWRPCYWLTVPTSKQVSCSEPGSRWQWQRQGWLPASSSGWADSVGRTPHGGHAPCPDELPAGETVQSLHPQTQYLNTAQAVHNNTPTWRKHHSRPATHSQYKTLTVILHSPTMPLHSNKANALTWELF